VIKKSIIILIFILLFINMIINLAYPSSEKESKDIKNFISSTYPTNTNNKEISKLINSALKNGVTTDQIKSLISRSHQYKRDFSEVLNYMKVLDELSNQGILSDHIVNIILEGLAKGAASKKILEMINDEKSNWIFCTEISKEVFSKEGLKKRRNIRVNLEKTMLMLIDVGVSKNSIKELAITIRKNKRDAAYFNLILKVALEIKSMGLKNETITKILKIAIDNNISSGQLMNYLDIISNKISEGKSEDEIAETIINNIKSNSEKREKDVRKKTESHKSSTSKGGKTSKPGNEHKENKPGTINQHKK